MGGGWSGQGNHEVVNFRKKDNYTSLFLFSLFFFLQAFVDALLVVWLRSKFKLF